MRRIGRRAKILAVVIVYFLTCSTVFLVRYAKDGSGWVVHPANQNVYANGELKTSKKVDLLLRAGAADTGFVLGNAAALGILALADAKKAQSQGSSTCAFMDELVSAAESPLQLVF